MIETFAATTDMHNGTAGNLSLPRPASLLGSGYEEAAPSGRHVLDARQFARGWLEETLFPRAAALQEAGRVGLPSPLAGKRLFYLFYETSTRTRVSFESAVTLLGGSVTGMEARDLTPEVESLEDRVRVIGGYGYDFILLRYHEQGGADRAASVSRAPLINAGDGSGQHPTQALLDVYTLWRELGRVDGLRIALVGDLRYERTTNSLAYLLARFKGLKLYFVSPNALRISDSLRHYLILNGVGFEEVRDLRDVAGRVDAVYMTRAHSPRLEHAQRLDGPAGFYRLTADVMSQLSQDALVLHPLPRGAELPPELDADRRIGCFRQAENGLYVRMALLTLLAQ